ncbi:MAG TPA: glycosyltransferase family 39 protein, partial [Gemmataceae bacterium]
MNVSRTKALLLPLAFVLTVAVSPWILIGTSIPYRAQDFPLIDDWAFTRGAYTFFHDHQLDYQHWASMPLLGQWLWSMPFLAVLGDSHLTMKVSTMVLSWLGLWAFYALLRRQAGVTPPLAAFATACLAWNPYFFLLSGTFMTDVPALSFSLLALALYAHAFESGRLLSLAAAVLVALAAVSTRQNAIVAPLTAGVLLLRSGYRTKPLWLAAVAAPIVAALTIDAWFAKRPDVDALHVRVPTIEHLVGMAFVSAHYLGMLAIPVLLLLPPVRRGKVFWGTLLAMTAVAFWEASGRSISPYEGVWPFAFRGSGHLFTAWGSFVGIVDQEPILGWHLRLLPTMLGCVCAAALLAQAADQGWKWATRPLVIFSLLHLATLPLAPRYFDRYLLPVVPGALALATWEQGRPRWKAGLAALAVLGGLSVGLMHDWLSRNAARWELGRRAIVHGIEPGDIQGGFEWDLWHREWWRWYPRHHQLTRETNRLAEQTFHLRHPGHYRLSLSGHDAAIDAEPFTQWFPPRKR